MKMQRQYSNRQREELSSGRAIELSAKLDTNLMSHKPRMPQLQGGLKDRLLEDLINSSPRLVE